MLGKTILKNVIFLTSLLLLYSPLTIEARTISLVYDDSGSMRGQNKWEHANYAVQALASLLAEDDKLLCIRMNASTKGDLLNLKKSRRRATLQQINSWDKPVNKAGTPYSSVQIATSVFTEKHQLSTALNESGKGGKGGKGSDWLIVTTDGVFFDEKDSSAEQAHYARVRQHAKRFFSSSAGPTTRIAFLLIGADADKKTAEIWKNSSPNQVHILTAESTDITKAMENIVRLIVGRDQQQLNSQNKDTSIFFSSIFPIERITLFEQGVNLDMAEVLHVDMPGRNIQPSEVLTLKSPGNSQVTGKVTHVDDGQILGAGDYQVSFDRNIENRQIGILVEPAVDFEVVLIGADDSRKLSKDSQGRYSLCKGDEVVVQVVLKTTAPNGPQSLPIASEIAKKLQVSGLISGKSLPFSHDQDLKLYSSDPITIEQERLTLNVETQYPGYFHLKSNVINIVSRDCTARSTISSSALRVPITYTDSALFVPATKVQVIRKGDQYPGEHTIHLKDLPSGIELEIQGNRLSQSQTKAPIDISVNTPVTISVYSNNTFTAATPVTLSLQFKTDNPHVTRIKPLEIVLEPQPRKLVLVPRNDKWEIGLSNLGNKPGPTFDLLIDGRKASDVTDEDYQLTIDSDYRLNIASEPSPNSSFQLDVQQYICPCFTSTGTIPINIRIDSKFPGESAELKTELLVEDISLISKCWPILAMFLLLILICIYLRGIITKARFSRDGIIVYERENLLLRTKRRPERFYLAGWQAEEGGRLWNLMLRWFLPYVPEQRTVHGIRFRAGTSANHILLPQDQQSKNMTIDLISIDEPGTRTQAISIEGVLQVAGRNHNDHFKYQRD